MLDMYNMSMNKNHFYSIFNQFLHPYDTGDLFKYYYEMV